MARQHLFNETLFFGLTEHWATSVCTFHCELGGDARESEFLNTRDNGGVTKDQLTGIKPEVRSFLDGLLGEEYRLYEDAQKVFLRRAEKCGCLRA